MLIPNSSARTFRPHNFYLFFILASLCLVLASPRTQAQSFLTNVDEAYTDVIGHITVGNTEAAERALDTVPVTARTGDYHYLQGVLVMQSMDDTGMLRMARLARRMRGHFEDAVEVDPDHALAHLGLMQFHRFAPGIMGGRQRHFEFHQQRLIELDSFLQFPAALVKAQVEEDEAAQRTIYESWINHSPQMFDAHYAYLSSLIGWAEFAQAREVIELALRHADHDQTLLVQYQQVRMAALFGLAQHEATTAELTATDTAINTPQPLTQDELLALDWFSEAHTTGIALLAMEDGSAQIDKAWLHMRLAQIEWALQDTQSALARLEVVRSGEADERLLAEAEKLQAKMSVS